MPFDPLGSGTIMRPVLTDATQAQKCSMPITLRQLLPVHLVFLFMNLDSGGPQGHVKGESISREEARNCNRQSHYCDLIHVGICLLPHVEVFALSIGVLRPSIHQQHRTSRTA